jgi:hypothetical protein
MDNEDTKIDNLKPQPITTDDILKGILGEIVGLRSDMTDFKILVANVSTSQIQIATILEQHENRLKRLEVTVAAIPCSVVNCPNKDKI